MHGLDPVFWMSHLAAHEITAVEHELLEALIVTRRFETNDLRDKLSGSLGLVAQSSVQGLLADYSKSTLEIYRNIATFFLMRIGSLRNLSCTCAVPEDYPVHPKLGPKLELRSRRVPILQI